MKLLQSKILRTCLLCLCIALLAVGTFYSARWALSLRDPVKLAAFQTYIVSRGFGGWLLLLAIQYLQIVIAFIPGGPIQIVAGALFGPAGGLATCVLGMLLATGTVFYLVSRYGQRLILLFVKEKELKQYNFLSDEKRLEKLVLILFLIPGTPKDALTYLFALTPIPLSRFMLLSIVARVPAALTSVLAGDSIAEGEWLRAVICFAALTAISLLGLLAQKKVMAFYRKMRDKPSLPHKPDSTPPG